MWKQECVRESQLATSFGSGRRREESWQLNVSSLETPKSYKKIFCCILSTWERWSIPQPLIQQPHTFQSPLEDHDHDSCWVEFEIKYSPLVKTLEAWEITDKKEKYRENFAIQNVVTWSEKVKIFTVVSQVGWVDYRPGLAKRCQV